MADGLGAINDVQAERMSPATLRELVQQELVVIGEASDESFAPSSERLEQSRVRLEGVGPAEERDHRGFNCWLSTTHRGDARARRLHARSVTDGEHGGR